MAYVCLVLISYFCLKFFHIGLASGLDFSSYPVDFFQHTPNILQRDCYQECPRNTFGTCLLPYDKFSRYFYQCVEGEAMLNACPLNHWFSLKASRCLPKNGMANTLNKIVVPVNEKTESKPQQQPLSIGFTSKSDNERELLLKLEPLVERLRTTLEKFNRIEKTIELSEKKMSAMNKELVEAVKETSATCQQSSQNKAEIDETVSAQKSFQKNDSKTLETILDTKIDQVLNEGEDGVPITGNTKLETSSSKSTSFNSEDLNQEENKFEDKLLDEQEDDFSKAEPEEQLSEIDNQPELKDQNTEQKKTTNNNHSKPIESKVVLADERRKIETDRNSDKKRLMKFPRNHHR